MIAKIPNLVKKLFPERSWDIPSEKKQIFLTFDDGPIPEVTPWVLEQLKKFNAKATFFCIGENIQKHPEIFPKIISEGHSIGNHTQNHLNGWKTTSERYLQNVLKAEAVIEEGKHEKKEEREEKKEEKSTKNIISDKFQNTTEKLNSEFTIHNSEFTKYRLFRPPYGRITGKQAKLLRDKNYKIVMWDVLSMDYDKNISAEKCFENVVKNAISGSIIVFHDSLKAEKNLRIVLPLILEHYQNLKFSFEKIDF